MRPAWPASRTNTRVAGDRADISRHATRATEGVDVSIRKRRPVVPASSSIRRHCSRRNRQAPQFPIQVPYVSFSPNPAKSCFWLKRLPWVERSRAPARRTHSSVSWFIRNGLRGLRFPTATKCDENTAYGVDGLPPLQARFPESLVAQGFRVGWPVACLCPGTGTATKANAEMAEQLAGIRTKKDTGNLVMPAARHFALTHRNACNAASARMGGSVPFRCMTRAGHAHHVARCMHASAERRLEARCPQGMCGGPGRWPFHACAICAPPCCRVSRH